MTRPATFDARVMGYYRLLCQFARRYYAEDVDKQNELVQGTIVRALTKWEKYREDGSFSNWLRYLMWQQYTADNYGKLATISADIPAVAAAVMELATPPTQEATTDAAKVVRLIGDDEVMLLVAGGYQFAEIAVMRGVTRSAIGQHVARRRVKLAKAMRRRRTT